MPHSSSQKHNPAGGSTTNTAGSSMEVGLRIQGNVPLAARNSHENSYQQDSTVVADGKKSPLGKRRRREFLSSKQAYRRHLQPRTGKHQPINRMHSSNSAESAATRAHKERDSTKLMHELGDERIGSANDGKHHSSDDSDDGANLSFSARQNKKLLKQMDTVSNLMQKYENTSTEREKSLSKWTLGIKKQNEDKLKQTTVSHALSYHQREEKDIRVTSIPLHKMDYQTILSQTIRAEQNVSRLCETMRKSLEQISNLRRSYENTVKSANNLREVNSELEMGMQSLTQKFENIKEQRDELSKKLTIFQKFVVDKDKQVVTSLKREKNNSKKLRGHLSYIRQLHKHRDRTITSLFDIAKKQKLTVEDLFYYYTEAMQEYKALASLDSKAIKTSEIEQYFKTLEKVHENILEQTIRLLRKQGLTVQEDMYIQHGYMFQTLIQDENLGNDTDSDDDDDDLEKRWNRNSFAQQTDVQHELPEAGPYGYVELEEPADGFREVQVQADSIRSTHTFNAVAHQGTQTEVVLGATEGNSLDASALVMESINLNSAPEAKAHKHHLNTLLKRTMDHVLQGENSESKQETLTFLRTIQKRLDGFISDVNPHTFERFSMKLIGMVQELRRLREELISLLQQCKKEASVQAKSLASDAAEEIMDAFRELADNGGGFNQSHPTEDGTSLAKKHKRKKLKRSNHSSSSMSDGKAESGSDILGKDKTPELLNYIKMMMKVKKRQLANADLLTRMRDIFRTFDADLGGSISWREAQQGLRVVGAHLSKRKVQRMMSEVDDDGNGVLDWSEFCHLILQENTEEERDAVIQAGYLTEQEKRDKEEKKKLAGEKKKRFQSKRKSSSKLSLIPSVASDLDLSDSDMSSGRTSSRSKNYKRTNQMLREEVKSLRKQLEQFRRDEGQNREALFLPSLSNMSSLQNPDIEIQGSTPVAEAPPDFSIGNDQQNMRRESTSSNTSHNFDDPSLELFYSDLQLADQNMQQNLDNAVQEMDSYSSRLQEASRKYDTSLLVYNKKIEQVQNQKMLYEKQMDSVEAENVKYKSEIESMRKRIQELEGKTSPSHHGNESASGIAAASPYIHTAHPAESSSTDDKHETNSDETIQIYESQVKSLTEENSIIEEEKSRTESQLKELRTEHSHVKALYEDLQKRMQQMEMDKEKYRQDLKSLRKKAKRKASAKRRRSVDSTPGGRLPSDNPSPTSLKTRDEEYRKISLDVDNEDDGWFSDQSENPLEDEADAIVRQELRKHSSHNSFTKLPTTQGGTLQHRKLGPQLIRKLSPQDLQSLTLQGVQAKVLTQPPISRKSGSLSRISSGDWSHRGGGGKQSTKQTADGENNAKQFSPSNKVNKQSLKKKRKR